MLTKDFYQDEMLGYLGGVQREIEVTLPETGASLAASATVSTARKARWWATSACCSRRLADKFIINGDEQNGGGCEHPPPVC